MKTRNQSARTRLHGVLKLSFSFLIITTLLISCKTDSINSKQETPFDWRDGTSKENVEVSPDAAISVLAPKIEWRGVRRFGIPERISVAGTSSEKIMALLKEMPNFKGKSNAEIMKAVEEGKVGLTLMYVSGTNVPVGLFSTKSLVLKPDFSNLKAIDLTIDVISAQKEFAFQTDFVLTATNKKAYFVQSGAIQTITLAASDLTETEAYIPARVNLMDRSGFGEWVKTE